MKSLSYLNKYFLKYKWRLLLGVLFIVLSNYLFVYMPLIVKEAVNNFREGFDSTNWLNLALSLGGFYILLSLGKGVFLFFQRQTIIKVSRYIEFDLKNEIYQHYQRLNYNFYKKNSTGDLMNRISEDVAHVRMYLGPGVMYSVNLVILFAFVLYFMMDISVPLTLYVLTPLPLMSFLIYKVSNRMNKQSERVQRQQSGISTIVQESFSGIAVLKAYSGEKRSQERFNEAADGYLDRQMDLVKTNAYFMPTITFLIGLSTVLTIYLGGIFSYDPASGVTDGDIVAFIFYVNMLTWPFASIGWVTSLVQRAAASQERINEFLKSQPEIVNPTEDPFNFKGSIEFRNISFTYPNSGIEAINNLSFTVNKGETLAILGRTGSGKSSVIHLLMRQFDPNKGEILIDGKPLNSINLEQFRSQTGVVPQEVFLFSDSIRNNILFGLREDENRSDDEINAVMKTAHVYHNVVGFKEGLDTLLGERGVNLSGGQKQRISICRALIRQPKFLILDDCLSAVDTDTEDIILNNLKEQIKNNTTLIVSHRVSSIRYANKILVLDNGNKIEEGTHEELLAKKGVYYDIYQKQLLESAEQQEEQQGKD
jgi:ATP-binding cassette, subfamily B, multidrug efflux pump